MNSNFILLMLISVFCVVGALFDQLFFQLLIISLIGVMCHYLNGINKSIIDCDPVAYFGGAFTSTLMSLGSCIVVVFSIVQAEHAATLNYLTAGAAFSGGYMLDSALNKSPS